MAEILPNLFGYHLVQIGEQHVVNLAQTSRITHKVILHVAEIDTASSVIQPGCSAITDTATLPLAATSVDVVLLPHVLEFTPNPHEVLREVERILIGEGHMVIIGFNPISLFGLWRMLLGWRKRAPWTGHYFSIGRLKDWLTLLGFEIVHRKQVYFRPPCRRGELNDKLSFLERLGARLWPYCGGISIIVARKRILPLTLTRMHWKSKPRLAAVGVADPTSRTWAASDGDEYLQEQWISRPGFSHEDRGDLLRRRLPR